MSAFSKHCNLIPPHIICDQSEDILKYVLGKNTEADTSQPFCSCRYSKNHASLLINECRSLKFYLMPQDIWDRFRLWCADGADALARPAWGL